MEKFIPKILKRWKIRLYVLFITSKYKEDGEFLTIIAFDIGMEKVDLNVEDILSLFNTFYLIYIK
jgi:hypothetical protein